MSERTTIGWVDPRAFDDDARRELWRFVARHEDLAYDDFARRLDELSHVLVGRYASGEIGGLVAARIFTVRHGGADRTVVWGEWGLLDRPFRGRLLLERAMLHGVLQARLRRPLHPVYFMAEAASWRGYLALARGFAQLWPRPGHPLPEAERAMVREVLARHGDPQWNPARGVFHRGKPMQADEHDGRVPDDLRALHAFYQRANPGQAAGDSLLVVAPFPWAALVTMPLRTLLAQLRRPRAGRTRRAAA
jgi:hypothetical protein